MATPINIRLRRFAVFLFDSLAVGVAFVGAYLLRFDFVIPPEHMVVMKAALPWVFAIQVPILFFSGLYRGVWHFASVRDLTNILRASVLAVLATLVVMAMTQRLEGWARSVFLLDGTLLVIILAGARFTYRFLKEGVFIAKDSDRKTLIIGAGATGNSVTRELSQAPSDIRTRVVGYLDDNPRLIGMKINGAPVLGPIESLSRWIEKKNITDIIIAISELPGPVVKKIVVEARDHEIACRIVPSIRDVVTGKSNISQLREVDVEDLLRRDTVKVDRDALKAFLGDKSVMVTGAGGSIGSELSRQIFKFRPRKLICFERSESNLYRLEKDFREKGLLAVDQVEIKFVIGDILDSEKLRSVFQSHHPEVILHAAAYKHVPIMEENPYDAIRNNVCGTYNLAKEASDHGVSKLIMVSTDKAVRPTSVMGASKRMSELVCHAIGSRSKLITMAVRFGNVLDSDGSVLPLFREQISRGGPVTVTDPKASRYFMTIPEASTLVLQAACQGSGNEVFLLDMGEPVLIREMAEELITLSGLQPYKDVDVVFTGLRKGEKLHEELLDDIKNAETTSHPKIFVSSREHESNLPENWEQQLLVFLESHVPPREEIVQWLWAWVPEYGERNRDNPTHWKTSAGTIQSNLQH